MSTIGRVCQAEKPAEDRGLCPVGCSFPSRRAVLPVPLRSASGRSWSVLFHGWDSNVLITLRRDA